MLASETSASADDFMPKAAAALLAAAHRTLFQQVLEPTSAGDTNQRIATIMARTAGQVFGLLEPSLAHYAVCRAGPER
ncbi:hypothetical protein OH786_01315 [Streptomyces atratus]|uniref:TetR family transcriptional regulator n=1 Tax=Streptomyces atratus TaxID=1893 RepID=A0A1K1YEP7_STRAR|nr:hypothetical protein [Streptomyces atratus]SFX60296.1 hypothetical protein SAMN02787144_1004252 [Streptomyces atratus]